MRTAVLARAVFLICLVLLAAACGGGGSGGDSTRVTPPPPPPPSAVAAPEAPSGLTVQASGDKVALSWTAPAEGGTPDTYSVYRGSGDSCTDTMLVQEDIAADSLSIEDETVDTGTVYCYQVAASNAGGEGPRSDEAVVTAVFPGPPRGLGATPNSDPAIVLNWETPLDDGGGMLDGYNVFRCVEGDTTCLPQQLAWVPLADGTTYTDSDVSDATRYRYAVGSARLDGLSDWSNEVTAEIAQASTNTAPYFPGDTSIGDLVFVAGTAIEPVTLPRALGGNVNARLNEGAPSDYSFDPPDLPRGLTFDRFTRVLEGTPTQHMEKSNYTLWVHDDDEDYSVADAASLSFTIEVTGDIRQGETPAPRFAEGASIGDLVFTVGVEIDPITLPQATSGDIDVTLNGGRLSDYSFDPVELPAGLIFDRFTGVLSGFPAQAIQTTAYTLWVHDDDDDNTAEDADSLAFSITVNASAAGLDGTFLQTYQYMERSDWDLARDPGGTTWSGIAWLDDRVHAPLMVWADGDEVPDAFEYEVSDLIGDGGKVISGDQVGILFPTYVEADPERRRCNGYGTREGMEPAYLADALSASPGAVGLPDDPFKIWLTVDVPRNACPADYEGTFTVKTPSQDDSGAQFAINLKVLSLDLTAPSEWEFALDVWQHPDRVLARYDDAHPDAPIERWSDAHYQLLEDAYRLLASAGQKAITAMLKDGAFGAPGMVSWTRVSESRDEWEFDFSVFGTHVRKLMSWGIDERIDAYGILGWNRDEIPYWSVELQSVQVLSAPVGSAAHTQAWRSFLPRFRAYLQENGWFDRTYLAIDEGPAQAAALIDLIQADDRDWKVALSHFDAFLPETVGRQVDLMNVSVGVASNYVPQSRETQLRTLYTSCLLDEMKPITRLNSLVTRDSNPADVEWLTWYVEKLGMQGYSRWAYDFWRGSDPLDLRGESAHTSGDVALIYRTSNDRDLKAVTSVRFEILRQGIQAYEKRRILRGLYTQHDYASGLQVLDGLLEDEFISTSGAADGHAKSDLVRARQQLDTLSIEASSLVTADPRCN